jgi:hypothetical protein
MLPLAMFTKHYSNRDGLRSDCKACRSVAGKADYLRNKTAIDARHNQYSATHKAEARAYNQRNRAAHNILGRIWREENRAVSNMHQRIACAKHKAKRLGLLPAWADINVIAAFYRACPPGMVVDHIVPHQGDNVSGFHVANNLQYLTPDENGIKGNRWM